MFCGDRATPISIVPSSTIGLSPAAVGKDIGADARVLAADRAGDLAGGTRLTWPTEFIVCGPVGDGDLPVGLESDGLGDLAVVVAFQSSWVRCQSSSRAQRGERLRRRHARRRGSPRGRCRSRCCRPCPATQVVSSQRLRLGSSAAERIVMDRHRVLRCGWPCQSPTGHGLTASVLSGDGRATIIPSPTTASAHTPRRPLGGRLRAGVNDA